MGNKVKHTTIYLFRTRPLSYIHCNALSDSNCLFSLEVQLGHLSHEQIVSWIYELRSDPKTVFFKECFEIHGFL